MSSTPLPKAAKPVWAVEPTRLPCLVACVKFRMLSLTKIGKLCSHIKIYAFKLPWENKWTTRKQ